MNNRLNDKLTIAIMTGVIATTLIAAPHYATAIGIAEKAQLVQQSQTLEQFQFFLPFKLMGHESYQPIKENEKTPVIEIQDEVTKQQKLKDEHEAKVQEERTAFMDMIKQKDIKNINLTTPSGLTADEIEKILINTQLAGLGQAFADAEKNNNVNAYYLIAHAAWESAWGESRLAKNKNNLFGFSAYDESAYSSGTRFDTKAECIDVVAAFISEHYLTENGNYYNGANLKGMNKKYASDKKWAQGIADTIENLVDKSNAL
jgi:beta-N-acetylglucosaminidase